MDMAKHMYRHWFIASVKYSTIVIIKFTVIIIHNTTTYCCCLGFHVEVTVCLSCSQWCVWSVQ